MASIDWYLNNFIKDHSKNVYFIEYIEPSWGEYWFIKLLISSLTMQWTDINLCRWPLLITNIRDLRCFEKPRRSSSVPETLFGSRANVLSLYCHGSKPWTIWISKTNYWIRGLLRNFMFMWPLIWTNCGTSTRFAAALRRHNDDVTVLPWCW